MGAVLLTDVVIPEVYMSYTAVDSPELTAFFESGVAVSNPALSAAFGNGGDIAVLPFWLDLDASVEPNYSTDLVTDVAVPNKVTASKMVTRIAFLNQGYSSPDLVAELAGSNPMQRIRNRFGSYWTKQWQRRLIAACNGILANNLASDDGDMVNNVALETKTGVTDANLFTRSNFTGAIFTLGDHFGEVAAIAVHSVVYKRMVDNDDVEFVRPSIVDPNVPLEAQMQPYFLGKRVIVDDGMPVIAGTTDGYKFVTMLFGVGAIGYAEGSPLVPVATQRWEAQGNGAGVEQIWERKSWIIHPFGHKFDSNTVAGISPTNAEMARADNWTRVVERKNVPIAFLYTNG
jgi:hypothetical protein